jgi:hypothetical protein
VKELSLFLKLSDITEQEQLFIIELDSFDNVYFLENIRQRVFICKRKTNIIVTELKFYWIEKKHQ